MESNVIVVGEREFTIGKAKAPQIATIMKILSKISSNSRKEVAKAADDGGNSALWAFLGGIDENMLVEFAATLIGSDKAFAAEHFDLMWVSEAFAIMMEQTDLAGVIRNFTRIASRVTE